MIENKKTLSNLNRLRKNSFHEPDEDTDKKDSLIFNKEHASATNSKLGSEINKLKSGFTFSLGSKVLKSNLYDNREPKILFYQNKKLRKKSTIVKKEKNLNREISNTKTLKYYIRKLSNDFINQSTYRRKGSMNSNMEIKEEKSLILINEIYNKFDDNYEPKIIKKLKEVEKCSILKYGIKPSLDDISYSYCLTCDSSLINPICIPCINHCHSDHVVKEDYEIGKIICSCGERSHLILNSGDSNYRKNINECLCNEWGQTSKLNICYINSKSKDKDYVCILCYNFCITEKKDYSPYLIKLNDEKNYPKCICKNKKVHNEFRYLLNIIEKMTANYINYDGINLLHPTQIINALINSKKSFTYNFDSFNDLFNSIKNKNFLESKIHYSLSKVNFQTTNCFVIMKSILNIISFNSHSNISYYSQETEKYFSLEIIQNLFENLKKSKLKEGSIMILSYNYLQLFRKVYIGNKTQIFDKYKLEDLDNFSSSQRFSLFYKCGNKFPQSEKIISFFLQYLQEINLIGFTCIEAIPCLGEIFAILKKMAYFNLISNGNIIRVLQEIEKFFMNLHILRNSLKVSNKNCVLYKKLVSKKSIDQRYDTNEIKIPYNINRLNYLSSSMSDDSDILESPGVKMDEAKFYQEELSLYYTIIKLIRIFYFNFNDRLVHNIVNDNIKFPNNNLFNNNYISFGYMKNDFGRGLFKVTIKILFIIHKINKGKEKAEIYKKILYHGMKILEYSLMNKDSYLISLIRSLNKGEFYENKINNLSHDKINNNELNLLIQEKQKLDNYNQKFLNFEINNEELITNYKKSLDNILKEDFKDKKIIGFKESMLISILKSKYFFTLSKIYRILFFFNEKISGQYNSKMKISSMIYTQEKIIKEKNLLDELTPKILYFYKNFIYHNSENSLLILSHYIFNDLTKIPIKYGEENFLLFHSCLENISDNNIENILNNSSHYLNNLYNYLIYLNEKNYFKINECLLIFLKCFYVLAINIKTADYELLIKNIRKIIIEINELFNISKNFFKYDDEGVSEIMRKIEKQNQNENGMISENKSNINNDLNESIYNNSIPYNENKKNDKSNLEQCFIIDLQLINDFFDFELTEQKEKIMKLIDIHKIIYCLKFQNISHLALRTQMIRFVRKMLIDMNYNKECNYVYINSIINNEDYLSILKLNPLVNNYKYPTKLFSYIKDFWNLSMKSKFHQNVMQINKGLPVELFSKKNTEDANYSEDSSSFESEETNKQEKKEINKKLSLKDNNSKVNESKPDEELDYVQMNTANFENKENNFNNNNDNIKCFDTNIYDLLINELSNVNDIISDINISSTDEMQALGEYFQHGLLIPIIYFLKKSYAVAHNFKGLELVKLYDLVVQTINLKITISEFKYNFWDDKNEDNYNENFEDDLFSTHMLNNRKDFLINGNLFIGTEIIKKSNNILKRIRNKTFSCFDYSLLYNIIEKNLFNLLNQYNQNSIGDLFSEKEEDINMIILNKPIQYNISEINEKLYKIYLLYKHNKDLMSDENNSSLFNILPEICIEFGTNYRNILLFILISNSLKLNINNNNHTYSISLYFLLYKLLSIQTSKTQAEIINLLGGSNNNYENLGFMETYSQHLMKRIILLFIEASNPKDKYFNDNFLFAINLIKIFKFLCEEHNNFFQMRLIKTLNYQYMNIVPFFYKENKNFKEFQSQLSTNIGLNYKLKKEKRQKEGEMKIKNVKFFDFYLFVLLKISLIAGWDGFQKYNSLSKKKYFNPSEKNKNIYDLFASIIEMLNEIIQGNKEENLSRLGNPFLKEENNYSSDDEDDFEDLVSMEINIFNELKVSGNTKTEKYEKYKLRKTIYQKHRIEKDPFTCFLKEMIKFIFIDNNDSQILYQLRNDLMLFFTSILEEKHCNEEVQKLIIKYINIHRVFNSISSILKNYFLFNVPLDSLPPDFFPIKIDKNIDSSSLTMENYLTQKMNTTMNENKESKVNPKIDNLNINALKEKLIFDHRLLNFYYENYYSNQDFFTSNEFQLTNAFYKYIKLIAVLGKNEEIKSIIEEVESTNITTAIKKFEPNILNIKKDPIKDFNHKDIKTQIRLSKSLKNKKTLKTELLKKKRNTLDASKLLKLEKISNPQILESTIKNNENFKSSIYTNSKFVSKFSLIQKDIKINYDISNSNIGQRKQNLLENIVDNNESSERVLDAVKKDNESSIKKLEVDNNKNKIITNNNMQDNFNNNINNINYSIDENENKKRDLIMNIISPKKKNNIDDIINNSHKKNKNKIENNENEINSKINIESSTNKLNLNSQKTFVDKERKPRISFFFKVNDSKNTNYSLIPDNTKEYYDKDYIERFYIVKFFESITSTVEVRNEDCTNQTVIFTHLPEMIYLSNGTKAQFEHKVNRESEISKKNDLVRHLEYFHKEIEYFKNNYSSISHWVSKFDFLYVKWVSYILALLLNLLALFTISGDNILSSSNDNSYDILKVRRKDRTDIEQRINFSINKWQLTYDILNYIYIFLNGILIIIWIYFRLPLYYKLDKIKFFQQNIHKKTLNIRDKLYIIIVMAIYERNSITSLIYLFIVSIISSFLKRGQIIFPFLLLAIIDLNETLKNVILSIKLRYKEFVLCFFLAFIFMYGLSNIAFFYYNSDFEQELDYYNDNVCKTLVFCVLNAIDSGLRARGGIGDSGKRISFLRDNAHYIQRIILDDIFFFLIVIISIDLVFGIIIGEFAALREETQKHENDRKYHCFICHINKNTVEKNRKDFSVHVNKEHNLWNYVSYMIFVKLSNIHDLNSINSYARQKIDNKDISWLPSYKDFIDEDKDNKIEDDKDEDYFKIEDENINHKYIVKST